MQAAGYAQTELDVEATQDACGSVPTQKRQVDLQKLGSATQVPGSFTFTLAQLSARTGGVEAMRPVGSALLVARNGNLDVFDLSVAESPAPIGSVAGVTGAAALAVTGTSAFLAGGGQVVHYELRGCGTAPFAPCLPAELERLPLTPPGASVTAVAATPGAAYLAVGGGTELALLAQVAGSYAVVARDYVASGNIRALETVPGALVILVQDSTGARVELRGLQSGSLPLLGTISSLATPGSALASEGGRVAVAAGDGVHLIDAANPAAPVDLGTWTPDAAFGGAPRAVALAGPWLFAASGTRAAWVDTTAGFVQRTWVATTARQVAITNGVALAATVDRFTAYELPYPVLAAQSPLPSGTLEAGGLATVSLSGRLPLSVALGTTLELFDGPQVVPGVQTGTGATVRYQPGSALTAGGAYQARLTLGPTPFVGGSALGPWNYGFTAVAPASAMRVDAVNPGFGGVAGGTTAIVTGVGFDSTSQVFVGGLAATVVGTPTATELQFVAPAGSAAGPALVRVQNGNGDAAELPAGFVYVAPLTLSGVAPLTVDVSGGWVAISGGGFTRGLGVSFDGVPALTRSFLGTSVEAFVPAGAAGPVALGLSQTGAAALMAPAAVTRRDQTAPVVVSVSPFDTLGANAIPLASVFTFRFSEPIDPGTAGALRLTSQGATNVAGTRSVSSDGLSITFTPAAPLTGTSSYAFSATGVADLGGNALSSGVWSFRTVDLTPPTVWVSLTGAASPIASGAMMVALATWEFDLHGTDDSGQVSALTLSIDGVAVPPTLNKPFHYSWPASAIGTSSSLAATATDVAGNSAQFQVTVQIVGDQPPTCGFTLPAMASVTAEEGATLAWTLAASDDHLVSKLEVFLDGVPLKRSTGLFAASASLSGTMRLALAGAAVESHALTARAVDDQGLGTSCPAATVTVTPDSTPPVVSLVEPSGAHVMSGAKVRLTAAASDSNGVVSLSFAVGGSDLVTLTSPAWSAEWSAPNVTAAQVVTLSVRASDARGNEGTASVAVTVDAPSAKPVVSIASPPAGQSFVEGDAVAVTVVPAAQAGVASVELGFDGQAVTLSRPPWTHVFTAPAVTGASKALTVTAVAVDRLGTRSSTAARGVTVTGDGLSSPMLSLSVFPQGPLFAGGSSLKALTASDAGAGSVTATVAGVVAGSGPSPGVSTFVLPLGPEDAGVVVLAQVVSAGGDPAADQASGRLAVFARGAPDVLPDLPSGVSIAGLAVEGERLLLLRGNGGGASSLELRSRAGSGLLGTAAVVGAPVGVAFAQGAAAVITRSGGVGRAQLFSLPGLAPGAIVALRARPSSVARLGAGLVIGTEEGLELRDGSLQLFGRLPLGPVAAVAVDGERLYAVAAGQLFAVDASLPYSPTVMASVPAPGATAVASVPGQVCTAGVAVSCYPFLAGAFGAASTTVLPGPALSASAVGPWLVVGGASGLAVLDARSAPASAGYFPAMPGLAVASGGDLFAAGAGALSHLALGRGLAAPLVSLSLAASAAHGARLSLVASVADESEPLNAYAAELLVDGSVVQVLDGQVPAYVDLPAAGASATVVLEVRDLAGNLTSAQRVVSLVDDGQGPALAAVGLPAEALSATRFAAVALPVDPRRVAAVEFTLDGQPPLLIAAPALVAQLNAPAVSVDTAVSVSAVAIDALGRRGAPVTSQLLIHPDATPAPPIVFVARVGTGAIFEGTDVAVLAQVTSIAGVAQVRFSVDGVEQAIVAAPPFLAALRMPLMTGARTVVVQAVAVDVDGRESAPFGLSLVVVDDLAPPTVSLSVEPTGTVVSAGSRVTAAATALDRGGVDTVALQVSVAGVVVATGGDAVAYDVPASTPEGATLEVLATATDVAGNVGTAGAVRAVVVQSVPAPAVGVVSSLAGATALALLGDHAYVATPQGLWVAAIAAHRCALADAAGAVCDADSRAGCRRARNARRVGARRRGPGRGGRLGARQSGGGRTPGGHLPRGRQRRQLLRLDVGDRGGGRIDVQDPAQPVAVTGTGASGALLGAKAEGPMSRSGTGLYAAPSSYLLVPGSAPRAVDTDGDVLVVGTDLGLTTFFADPFNGWLKAGTLSLAAPVRSLAVAGGLAYVACADGRLRVVDVREPRTPRQTGAALLDASALTVSGGVLYAATAGGVELVPLPAPAGSATAAKASLVLPDLPQGLATYRRGVFAAATTAGVQEVDFGIATLPVVVGPVAAGTGVAQVERVGQTVFYLDGTSLHARLEKANGTFASVNSTLSQGLTALGNVQRFSAAPGRVWSVAGGAVGTVSLATGATSSLVLGTGTVDVAGDESRAVVALGTGGLP